MAVKHSCNKTVIANCLRRGSDTRGKSPLSLNHCSLNLSHLSFTPVSVAIFTYVTAQADSRQHANNCVKLKATNEANYHLANAFCCVCGDESTGLPYERQRFCISMTRARRVRDSLVRRASSASVARTSCACIWSWCCWGWYTRSKCRSSPCGDTPRTCRNAFAASAWVSAVPAESPAARDTRQRWSPSRDSLRCSAAGEAAGR